jgi:hypothetical protein
MYEKPALRKVRLDVQAAVLANCHTSTSNNPNIPGYTLCNVIPYCWGRTGAGGTGAPQSPVRTR